MRMDISAWVNEKRGRSLALARAVGVSAPMVSDWANRKKPIPVERGAAIERATDGEVTRKEMFPDSWQNIWPELALPGVAEALAHSTKPATGIDSSQEGHAARIGMGSQCG
jgi:DNA-binding transcriptional regulator YdaS (Cro superfamily)